MAEQNQSIPRRPTKLRHKPIRWLSALVVLGVVLVSGTILADVVLVYTANTSVGPTIPGPFQFQNGADYAVASGIGIATTSYVGGGATSGPGITTTVHGIQSVGIAVFDVAEFAPVALTTNLASIGNVAVPTPSVISVGGLLCAYAFISTALPSSGTVGVVGAPAGCSATVPALGALSAGCTGGTAAVVTVNLISGAIVGPNIGGTCSVPIATGAGATILYISYWITASGAIAGTTPLNAFTVPVTVV